MSVELRKIIERERVPYPDKEKLFIVLGLLLSGGISMGKAADLLDLRVDELWLLMHRLRIKYSILDDEEIEEELDAYRRIFKNGA
jgi:predicted HTH domain antitoxin